ncbi:MAG: SGNH/GDSL hydrolase family protein [Chloroflexota bacterium]|nr:SGNH/GDSL hydrolase family protein [Chloroflexota bacterium]
MTLIFKAKQSIVFIGDSITDCGRREPAYTPLGDGYVHLIHDLLQAAHPESKLTVINKGISGNTILDLKSRWQSDVLEIKPDWLFIYIGVNDVWRFFEGNRDEAVHLPEFANIYRQLLKDAQTNTNAQIRLVSPYLAEEDPQNPFRNKLSQYQHAIDGIGEEFDFPIIHLQPAFDWAMRSKPGRYWTVDRVHPTREGHMLIALTILRTCGFSL